MSALCRFSPSSLLYFVRKRMNLISDIVFLPHGKDYPFSKLSPSSPSAMRKARPLAKMLATFVGLALWVREEVETSIREASAGQALTYFWKLARVPNAKPFSQPFQSVGRSPSSLLAAIGVEEPQQFRGPLERLGGTLPLFVPSPQRTLTALQPLLIL
jgi:hypothetical protein